MVQEALDEDGQWREIEDVPYAICGHSFHQVFLNDGDFEVKARTYKGAIKAKNPRFRLEPGGEEDNVKVIYSNEFDGEVAKVQFRQARRRAAVRRAFRAMILTRREL